ncbi:MAG: hypothetical protein EHM85_04590 [Desulfobacteraceae bacterium]|nr:MAG: hypothetical protein EHM85_04590 [Desulfobacteraceae bacterium]
MKFRTPFNWLPIAEQTRAFVVLFVLTIIVMVALQVLGVKLKTDAAPSGIVSFELAGTLPLAQKIIDSWGQTGRVYAGMNLGLDFLFIVAYASCIGLGCVMVARSLEQRSILIAYVGVVLAWALWLAALLDCIENYALINLLLGSPQAVFAALSKWCAIPKFLIVGLGIAYFILGALVARVIKLSGGAQSNVIR